MSKLLRCDALIPGCQFEARGSTEGILAAAGKHATVDHGFEVTDELLEKVKGAIQDE